VLGYLWRDNHGEWRLEPVCATALRPAAALAACPGEFADTI